MFNGSFAEGQSCQATLPEDDSKAFDMLASWLYSGMVHDTGNLQRHYIKLFILAENYDIVRLADKTMAAYFRALTLWKAIPDSTTGQ